MRIAKEIAALTKGSDRATAGGIISLIAECALGIYTAEDQKE